MTKPSYRVFLPDITYYQQTVACQFACPVHTDARGYVTAISRGDDERAYLIAREMNPFASTCGWVCGAPCEAACRRGTIDAPIAIRALKRFINDRYGVYLGGEAQEAQTAWPTYQGPQDNNANLGNSTMPSGRGQLMMARQRGEKTGKRVAIIGAGPAGLTAAHDLALLGHDVTIFEASTVAGGMLKLGVPEYRLSREMIDLEIASILALGPTIQYEQALGRDFTIADLRREYDAVFIGIGTYRSRKLNIDGEQLDGVLRAVDFLINVNLGGYNLDLGKRVLVIGGGNVAMDVARTAARLGQPSQSGGDLETALDVARTAVRLGTTQEVRCLVVEARREMLADPFEIEEAEKEGVSIENNYAPKRIVKLNGSHLGVETLDVQRAFDDHGRFNPQLNAGSEKVWECDSVIVAIGQTGELDWITPEDSLEVTPRGTLAVDKETLATTAPGVYAGGDIAFGPRLIINAVADGQRAARSIHAYMQNVEPRLVRKAFFTPIPKDEYIQIGPLPDWIRHPRRQPPSIPVNRRVGVATVEDKYSDQTAREQAGRCLVCTINPVFDGDLCILCNGCVDVCPTDCLKLVSAEAIDGDEMVATLVEKRATGWETASAMVFDPTRCIRCGLCAERCPTDAITMETMRFTEQVVYEQQS